MQRFQNYSAFFLTLAFLFILASTACLVARAQKPAENTAKSNTAPEAKQGGWTVLKPPAPISTQLPPSKKNSQTSKTKPASPDAPIESESKGSMNFKAIELEGEVVDAWCWSSGVMKEGRGPAHRSCGLACVKGGVSCGIVDDDNNLYIAAKSKAYRGCNEMLAPYVAKRVKIKGWLTERGGCRLIKVGEVVKDLGPAEKFYKPKK